jgi:hypothetical protein
VINHIIVFWSTFIDKTTGTQLIRPLASQEEGLVIVQTVTPVGRCTVGLLPSVDLSIANMRKGLGHAIVTETLGIFLHAIGFPPNVATVFQGTTAPHVEWATFGPLLQDADNDESMEYVG